jgi:hypothetical protein
MKRSIICSTMVYALGKDLGLDGALEEWKRQMAEPNTESLPVVRMFARVAAAAAGLDALPGKPFAELGKPEQFEIGVHVDIAATSIAKSRSRAFHVAKGADFWFACDDDVEASQNTVANLLIEADVPTPRIVVLPCYLRDRPIVGVKFSAGARVRGMHAPIENAATCCFVANRAALQLLDRTCQHLKFRDDDGVERLALFLEVLDRGQWLGEDFAFFQRAALAGVELVALMSGLSRHAEQPLQIDQLRNAPELRQ